MNIKSRLYDILSSREFLIGVLLAYSIFVFITPSFPSLDGGPHLHNAKLLSEFWQGNQYVDKYYAINEFFVPNWMSHIVLAILLTFVKSSWAIKIFFLLYIYGMVLSFRYFVKTVNPQAQYLTYLILPFIFSYLFNLGFYNFSLSFIFLFIGIACTLKYLRSPKKGTAIISAMIMVTSFYSNALTTIFLGLNMLVFIIFYPHSIKETKDRFIAFIPIVLPCLILLTAFIYKMSIPLAGDDIAFWERVEHLFAGRQFVTYDYRKERILTTFLMILYLVLIIYNIFWSRRKEQEKGLFHGLVFIVVLMLLSYLTISRRYSGGMLSDRLLYLFVIQTIILLVQIAKPRFLSFLLVTIFIVVNIFHTRNLKKSIKPLERQVLLMGKIGDLIEPNSTLYPVNCSSNWLTQHLSNYAGADKPLVIMDNYEASVGWFPILWKEKPHFYFDEEKNVLFDSREEKIDYILFYGSDSLKCMDNRNELMDLLMKDYQLVHNQYHLELYQLK